LEWARWGCLAGEAAGESNVSICAYDPPAAELDGCRFRVRIVDQATTNQVPVSAKYRNHDFRGRYGFYWWVNGIMASGRRPWPSVPPRTYTAHGKGSNFCFVIPEWNMVVVRMGTVPISAGNIAKGDRLCDNFFRSLAGAVEVSDRKGESEPEKLARLFLPRNRYWPCRSGPRVRDRVVAGRR
jgi:hypothetical protein